MKDITYTMILRGCAVAAASIIIAGTTTASAQQNADRRTAGDNLPELGLPLDIPLILSGNFGATIFIPDLISRPRVAPD